MKQPLWEEIAGLAGYTLQSPQIERLRSYRDWLRQEAIPAGGVGPGEAALLDERHIGDSLLFAAPFSSTPATLVDLGSGVGLPGIPLAILWPDVDVLLVDRAQKRIDLAKRASRVLGLENVAFFTEDIRNLGSKFPAIVSRATMRPETLASIAKDLLYQGE